MTAIDILTRKLMDLGASTEIVVLVVEAVTAARDGNKLSSAQRRDAKRNADKLRQRKHREKLRLANPPTRGRGRPKKSWARTRQAILERDQFICSYCLDDATQVDHVVPVAQQGPFWDHENLTAACAPCNRSKGALTALEWFDRDWGGRVPPWFRDRPTS